MSQFIFKFAKNCRVGDLVIPKDGEPMAHAYWEIDEITTDLVRYTVGYTQRTVKVVGDLNAVVMIRPTAPLHIRPEMFQQYYGLGGFWDPWPWGYKKPMRQLRQEIGEDLSADVFRRWSSKAYSEGNRTLKLGRPELAIRKMHERAILKFYDGSKEAPDGGLQLVGENAGQEKI